MKHEFAAFHMACGSGAGARGFNQASVKLGGDSAQFRCVGGIDNDPDACSDFELLAGVPALCGDLHKLLPDEIREYSYRSGLRRGAVPDVVFSSSPCKGFSRLLPVAKSKEPNPRANIGRSGSKPRFNNNMRVGSWEAPSLCVTSASRPDSGGISLADPRPRVPYRNAQLGVVSWERAVASITGSADVQNGAFAVADPRKPLEQLVIIIAADGTWHRAITTLELALLQSLPAFINGKPLVLAGTSSSGWRERIGNMVPADAAKAIAGSVGLALLASRLGTWTLAFDGVWVRERDHYAMPAEEAYA